MMFRTCSKLGMALLVSAVVGCGGDDNPAPKADESAPTAGLDALKQMQSPAADGKTGLDAAKGVKTK
jgi:hypothetical protein